MRSFFLFVCLLASAFCAEDLYKNYKYLSLGICGVKNLEVSAAQQIGLGYRAHHKRVFFIDSTDIFVSVVSNKASINTYSGYIFPRVLFLSYLTKEAPFYVGIGGAYLKEKIGQTTEVFINQSPIKIRKNTYLTSFCPSLAIGKTLYMDLNFISFAQFDINIPASDFITASFSINIGF